MIKKEYRGHTIGLFEDDLGDDTPRGWDNLGILISFHRKHNLTDKDAPELQASDFSGLDEIEAHLIKKEKAIIILPVYAYVHSDITISTKPFDCTFDSGQLGFIYTTRERIKVMYGGQRLTKGLREDCKQSLIGEIETYGKFLRGEGYGFVIDPLNDEDTTGELSEYCGGFLGEDVATVQAQASIDQVIKIEEKAAYIKTMPLEELPKYINHKWEHPAHEKMFLERMKTECLAKNLTPA